LKLFEVSHAYVLGRSSQSYVFAEAGETAQAKKMADSLAKETQIEPQAYAKSIEGKLALKQGDKALAIKNITDANNLLDTWIGRFELGRAYLESGQFTEADSEFDRCIKRRGETLELLMDNTPTYGLLPYVYFRVMKLPVPVSFTVSDL
jgi:tetratricopeptide (TPR) repeat protein